MAARKKSSIGLPKDMGPDEAYIQGMSDGLEEVMVESVAPKFSDFSGINVPLAPVRMELAALQKEGLEYMPLSDFLLLVHKCVKGNSID